MADDARTELAHIVYQALPPANTNTHMPSAHDVRIAIGTMAVILDNPDMVMRALGKELTPCPLVESMGWH